MTDRKLKLAVLTGSDSEGTCAAIERLVCLPTVELLGILLDDEAPSFRRRLRNLRRNIRREGVSYIWRRIVDAICDGVDRLALDAATQEKAEKLLRDSFPGRAFSLTDFARIHGIPVKKVGNLNSNGAAEALRELQPDLGIVLGTRILKRSTFSIPRLGSLNLHKGKVPEYRGQPAGFWEIYDQQPSAGVTVHFVDEGLDTGDVIGEADVQIHAKDSPQTLRRKLDMSGAELLAKCVSQLAEGTAIRRSQPKSDHKARTSPTRAEREAVNARLGLGRGFARWLHVVKTLLYLAIYHSGIYRLVRAWHKRSPKGRGCIVLYHRVNNLTEDPLTIGLKRFAEHLVVLHQHYSVVRTADLVKQLKDEGSVPASSVAIHFDDCYRDVYTNAARMLTQAGLPACAFISSGFVDTNRTFPHDRDKCPFQLENLQAPEVAALAQHGVEVGAHTVNHVDLGKVTIEEAVTELEQSKRDLESILTRPVRLVSYPYGRKWNIRPEVIDIARRCGYDAMFSAYGGYVDGESDVFDIRRVGASGQHRPLDLLMDIEGISLGALRFRFSGGAKLQPDGAG